MNRIEEINIWLRLWGEGIGLPREIWEDAEVQKQAIDFNDGAGTMHALCGAAWKFPGCPEIMNDPKTKLECLMVFDKYQLKS